MKNPFEPSACVEDVRLERYLRDELVERTEADVREHLEACSRCRERLERSAAGESIWRGVRERLEVESVDVFPEASGDAILDEVRALLGPTDDPRMLGRIGQYEIQGLIGQGSTGYVLKAFEERLNRYVAIKLMAPQQAQNAVARKRFEREGRAVAAVSHEHVVPVHAVDEHDGLPYIVMHYVGGASLADRIERDGPLDTHELTRIGLQVARGLAAAHAQGIVHRDVKPANVLLEGPVERVLVSDFGLAWVADETSMTRSGTIAGTPQFMSPEQARGDSVDARSDLFSLGSLLYTAATGRPPFRGETVYGVLGRVCDAEPRLLREFAPDVRAWFAAFVSRLMAKRPEDRFASADAAADVLAAELAHLQNPTGVAQPPRDWMPRTAAAGAGGRGRRRALVGGVGAAALAALAFVALGGAGDPEDGSSDWSVAGFASLFGLGTQEEDASESVVDADGWNRISADDGELGLFEQRLAWELELGPEGALALDVERGALEVVRHDGDQVRIEVTRRVRARDSRDSDAAVAGHAVDVAPTDGGMRFESRFEAALLAASGSAFESCCVRVALPDGRSLRVDADLCDVSITGISGSIDVRSEGGGVVLRETAGEAQVTAVHGDVLVAGVTGEVSVLASDGDVLLERNPGDVYAQTSGGDITIDEVRGGVIVHAICGRVEARVTEDPAADALFSAAGPGGDVFVSLAEAVQLRLEARGRVDSEFELIDEAAADGSGASWAVRETRSDGALIRALSSAGAIVIARPVEVAPDTDGPSGAASGDGGGGGLGGSEPSGGGLRGSGLGGSGSSSRVEPSLAARARTSGEPRAGALVSVPFDGAAPDGGTFGSGALVSGADDDGCNVDGYTLYLPRSFDPNADVVHPVIVYLQGSLGVGGAIGSINDWGLPRLLRDETDLDSERNALLLDRFIVVSPHITRGQYDDHPDVVERLLDEVLTRYRGDRSRVYLTGLSRGAHGTWGLAEELPGTFAAIVPIGGSSERLTEPGVLEGVAVWVAHNRPDPIVPFAEVEVGAERIERELGVRFHRVDGLVLENADDLAHRYLMTVGRAANHDAWTDLYCNAELYRWLLQWSLPVAEQPGAAGRDGQDGEDGIDGRDDADGQDGARGRAPRSNGSVPPR
ncbi:Serine/threonine-protein kinase PrkC [Planctomycetes bacterium Pla163]|uniref:Serine/threonine-protein kinase PrkC n=1 Tax=Rohdeia mirabilis TaxID=2528008 RepID=A0A518D0V5_9BACT|nr:Serine/threonine-protein kinase PrkC [Planctomycetes bacterium Pla163]